MNPPRVTICGGGLAGIAAALRLAQRGCRVTICEEKEMLGGNLASRDLRNGTKLDVYPHMFQTWYENFWELLAEAGVERESDGFTPFDTVSQLHRKAPGAEPRFTSLTKPYSPRYLLRNLTSGVARPADMFVFGFSNVDLLAEQVEYDLLSLAERTIRLKGLSLRGFLDSRLYLTPQAIEAYETYIVRIWGLPAYQISATDTRSYLSYCFPAGENPGYLTSGPAGDVIVAPLQRALEAAGVKIRYQTRVAEVTCDETPGRKGHASSIRLERTRFNPHTYEWVSTGQSWTEDVDELVLALPPQALNRIVRSGGRGKRLIDLVHGLAEVEELGSQRLPMLHIGFKDGIPALPSNPVGLLGSRLNLAFTSLDQVWSETPWVRRRKGSTLLALSCSEPVRLTGATPEDEAIEMLNGLRRYLDIPHVTWNRSPEVDWSVTRYYRNTDVPLSLNLVGTEACRPAASYARIANVAFAGDCCRHPFGITTVEAATATGLAAAHAIAERRGLEEVPVRTAPTWPAEVYVALRYAGLPAAFGAAAWASAEHRLAGEKPFTQEPAVARAVAAEGESLLRYLLTPGLRSLQRRPD